MIRNFLHRIFNRTEISRIPAPRYPADSLCIIPHTRHSIPHDHIHSSAIKVTARLQEAGFAAYIVGGAVRDLLLGLKPKDFDVVTDATPEEVRSLFRRSRIIGRRFRLVHVMCGIETIEVSTFRGSTDTGECDGPGRSSHTDEHGQLIRDNVFGSQEEDAVRRDFTINALFYDPARREIRDYLGGYEDIQAKRLRMIGDPVSRYREDPVRMLRAIRLSAKLDIRIEAGTAEPIPVLGELLQHIPPSRLFDEVLKLLLSGHALACIRELRSHNLHHDLLPMLDAALADASGERFITCGLEDTDVRMREEKPVSPGFLFAILLWHAVRSEWETRQAAGEKPALALHQAIDRVLAAQRKKLAVPRRYDAVMQEIWIMQPRFLMRSGGKPFRLLEHPRFRAAYDFMRLRCASGEADPELGAWWDTFQHAAPDQREAMLVKDVTPAKRKRNRGRRKSPAGTAGPVGEGMPPDPGPEPVLP